MEMQTGVRKLMLHFHKIHLNKHVSACHSSLNLECNMTTVKKHRGNFTGSSMKSNLHGDLHISKFSCQGDDLVTISQILNQIQTKESEIRVPQLSRSLLNGHIHLPKEPLVKPCFIQIVISKKVAF